MEYIYVTGCDTGFGSILVNMLDEQGKYGVFAGCYMSETVEKLKNTASDRVVGIQLDVSKQESVDACARTIKDHLAERPNSTLRAVVNNAGLLIAPGPIELVDTDVYHRLFNVNVMGTVMVTKSVLALIRDSQGRVINVASIAGRIALPGQAAYCISKYGVEAFSDALRTDLLQWGATVHIIEPGVFNKTGLYGSFQTGWDAVWEKQPDEIKRDYGQEFYENYRRMLGKALMDLGNTNSELVPEAMMDAICSDSPQHRYRVGFDSKYIVGPLASLPESIRDTVLTTNDGKAKAPRAAAAPRNGKKMAMARYKGSNLKWYLAVIIAVILYRRFRSA
ncbi:Retinol dehydrogenase 2 [Hondaea fermentalgiana]|uniref:Retinol dehydrogenase 2 n=1 Tax=Hondaea fermentalgiana TaxID=2315210 RepID=A0A2R5GT69_9STRA|nr:Retinol dehydrogenase 2 [Hondaea fermentalgiana]|eukprot:GBG32958.1 Retinol dehydrogenase 2 [Hondaea fermentalgiana]